LYELESALSYNILGGENRHLAADGHRG